MIWCVGILYSEEMLYKGVKLCCSAPLPREEWASYSNFGSDIQTNTSGTYQEMMKVLGHKIRLFNSKEGSSSISRMAWKSRRVVWGLPWLGGAEVMFSFSACLDWTSSQCPQHGNLGFVVSLLRWRAKKERVMMELKSCQHLILTMWLYSFPYPFPLTWTKYSVTLDYLCVLFSVCV